MLRRLTSPPAAVVVLALFWVLLVASAWNKSITYDELVHASAGAAYWKRGDYRMHPENGNLPQRIAALPLLGYELPPTSSHNWRIPLQWEFGEEWFHRMGHDTVGMLRRGRAFAALQAVALAALVWLVSRRLFGPAGAMVSLLACALNPTVLANGPLLTSDTLAAMFFLAATWAWWRLLQEVTTRRLVLCMAATGGLFVSKMSAALILPIWAALAVIRILRREPLQVRLPGCSRTFATRPRILGVMAAAAALQGIATFATIWGLYGFRYDAFAPGQPSVRGSAALWNGLLGNNSLPEIVASLDLTPETRRAADEVLSRHEAPLYGWSANSDRALGEFRSGGVLAPAQVAAIEARRVASAPTAPVRFILFLAEHRVLPEAYLLGTLHTWRFAQLRGAFFGGEFSAAGNALFFPATFAVKTPLALFGLLGLAAAAAWRMRPATLHDTTPLWVLFAFYWLAAINSQLNIGHRHILATYPPLFVLCGAAGACFVAGGRKSEDGGRRAESGPESPVIRPPTTAFSPPSSVLRLPCLAALALLGAETAWRFPNYLAYFNGIVTPSRAHRFFTDSTLDWGQDLPAVKAYIDTHPEGAPFHLSYFGNGDPRTYGIQAAFLPSNPGRFTRDLEPVIFQPFLGDATPELAGQLARTFPAHNYVGTGIQGDQRYAVLVRRPEFWNLGPGTYLVSASNLPIQWRPSDEARYHELREICRPFISASTAADAAAIRQRSMAEWRELLSRYESGRHARLYAFLRKHDPDDTINFSILVYRMSAADVAAALDGPPPYNGPFLNRTLGGR